MYLQTCYKNTDDILILKFNLRLNQSNIKGYNTKLVPMNKNVKS